MLVKRSRGDNLVFDCHSLKPGNDSHELGLEPGKCQSSAWITVSLEKTSVFILSSCGTDS